MPPFGDAQNVPGIPGGNLDLYSDVMHGTSPLYTSKKRTISDHKLEIHRRIICELIATIDVDDETVETGTVTASGPGNEGNEVSQIAKGRGGREPKPDINAAFHARKRTTR